MPAIAEFSTGEVMGHSADRLASSFGVTRYITKHWPVILPLCLPFNCLQTDIFALKSKTGLNNIFCWFWVWLGYSTDWNKMSTRTGPIILQTKLPKRANCLMSWASKYLVGSSEYLSTIFVNSTASETLLLSWHWNRTAALCGLRN